MRSVPSNSVRPAWVEIDLAQVRRNFAIINQDRPGELQFAAVVKDQAYGHGAVEVARIALESGATALAVATVDEALELRSADILAEILIFGERTEEELGLCLANDFTCFVNDVMTARLYSTMAVSTGEKPVVHVEVDTGMSRYGVRWTEAIQVIEGIAEDPNLQLTGIMSHFAMSDELDKTFALQQLERFQQVLSQIDQAGLKIKLRHMCNTGGFLDLPQAHLDLVRIGILPLGVYPSQVCRRIAGIKPAMSVKAKIAAIRDLQAGDSVGYGMRYRASSPRRIAVVPLGYGDGYPRVRNRGEVLIHGKRAPVVGGNAMDAMMIDVSEIPQARKWDEVVLMGKQGEEEISVHDLAALENSVSYDILAGWSWRLPRIYLNE